MGRAGWLAVALAGVVASMLVTAPPSAAAVKKPWIAWFASEPGDSSGLGEQRSYFEGNSTLDYYSDFETLQVGADGFGIQMYAPAGTTLGPGLYDDTRRGFGAGGHAGLDVSGPGSGCNTGHGRFEILDL